MVADARGAIQRPGADRSCGRRHLVFSESAGIAVLQQQAVSGVVA
jgi:hypothetical protein